MRSPVPFGEYLPDLPPIGGMLTKAENVFATAVDPQTGSTKYTPALSYVSQTAALPYAFGGGGAFIASNGTAYLLAGILHVLNPAPFLTITPDWVPYPGAVILLTGLCEIAGAVGLFMPRLRWWAGVLLAAYAACVYPANIKHAADYIRLGTGGLSLWYHVPRLAFQPVIIWWALFAGKVIDWPFGQRAARA